MGRSQTDNVLPEHQRLFDEYLKHFKGWSIEDMTLVKNAHGGKMEYMSKAKTVRKDSPLHFALGWLIQRLTNQCRQSPMKMESFWIKYQPAFEAAVPALTMFRSTIRGSASKGKRARV